MNENDSVAFWENQLNEDGLRVKRFFREIPLPPEALDTFPLRRRAFSRPIELPLQVLSPRQKEVIFCLFYDGLSENETAQVLGISRRSVRIHRKRALEKLKKALGNKPP